MGLYLPLVETESDAFMFVQRYHVYINASRAQETYIGKNESKKKAKYQNQY